MQEKPENNRRIQNNGILELPVIGYR